MDAVIFRKLSKLEWDARRYGEDLASMLELYQAQGISVEEIIDSHKRQLANFETLQQLLLKRFNKTFPIVDSWSFINGDKDSLERIRSSQVIVALVGDELATSVARVMSDGILIAINADPETSEGALLWPSVEYFATFIDRIPDKLPMQLWPKIRVARDGTVLGDAIGDVFLGATERRKPSCLQIDCGQGLYRTVLSSGLLACTGAGSTGWFRSASWHIPSLDPELNDLPLPKVPRFIVSEPYRGTLSDYQYTFGDLKDGQTLRLRSLVADGIIFIDNHTILRFDRDCEVQVSNKRNTLCIETATYKGQAQREVFIGNKYRQLISRYILTLPCGQTEHQKSSGLVLATPDGYNSWLRYIEGTTLVSPVEKPEFERQERIFKFVLTEPTRHDPHITHGECTDGKKLTVVSQMPEGSVISLDSYSNHIFSSGASVTLELSENVLRIVGPPAPERDLSLSQREAREQ